MSNSEVIIYSFTSNHYINNDKQRVMNAAARVVSDTVTLGNSIAG